MPGPLNYLGAMPGPGNTMPAGLAGSGTPDDPTMQASVAAGMQPGAVPMPPPAPTGPAPMGMPPGAGGDPSQQGGPPGANMVDPAGRQYEAVTQADGSVLLHVKNPDGSRGPAVKIIPPIKPAKSGAS